MILGQCGVEGHWLPTPTVENPHKTFDSTVSPLPLGIQPTQIKKCIIALRSGNCCWECENTVFHRLVESADVKLCLLKKKSMCKWTLPVKPVLQGSTVDVSIACDQGMAQSNSNFRQIIVVCHNYKLVLKIQHYGQYLPKSIF